MNEKDQLSMLSHYVGSIIPLARLDLKEGEPVDDYRINLIKKLETLGENDIVKQCIGILESTTWNNLEEVEKFYNKYEELNSQAKGMKDIVKKLYGKS